MLDLDASQLIEFQTPLVNTSMPVQDAIDLAEFLVDMTKRYVAFLPGADTVGGETDIATVTKYEGFRWIRRQALLPAPSQQEDNRPCHMMKRAKLPSFPSI